MPGTNSFPASYCVGLLPRALDRVRKARRVRIVHPERPLARRYHDLGVGEGEFAIGAEQTVDVVAVAVRDDHRVHRVAVDAGGGKIRVELADGALALLIHAETETGVDNDELRAGVDDNGRVGVRNLIRRQMVCNERRIDLVLRRVADVAVRQRIGVGAVGDGGDLKASDLIAIPARVLLLGERGCGLRPWDGKRRQRGNRCSCQ